MEELSKQWYALLNQNANDKEVYEENEDIDSVISQIYSHPVDSLFHLLRHKCRRQLEKKDFQSLAITLLLSQSISFRQQALFQYNKRLIRSDVKRKAAERGHVIKDKLNEEEIQMDIQQREVLTFKKIEEEAEDIIKGAEALPNNWRVVQISVDPRFRESLRFKSTPFDKAYTKANFGLLIVNIDCGTRNEIFVNSLAPVENGENPTIIFEFQEILSAHQNIFKAERNETRLGLEVMRYNVEDRLKSLLDTIENKWLGFQKVLLFGLTNCEKRLWAIKNSLAKLSTAYFSGDKSFETSGRKILLSRFLDLSSFLSEQQLKQGLAYCFEGESKDKFSNFVKDFEECSKTIGKISSNEGRCPVVLILDNEIQGLPWESLKCFQSVTGHQPFTRVPSFPFLKMLHDSHLSKKGAKIESVRNDKIFYVLNPDNNLTKTQERLEPEFRKMSLKSGVVGEQPSLQQITSVLTSWDAYMYCGHGANLRNVPLHEIEKLHVHAMPLLFGCNSGKLERFGRQLDPLGTVSHYLIASTPRMLGFLWSITDRDVDIWTIKLLEHWLGQGPGPHEQEFVKAVANLRSQFEWTINSAATVIYGLPDLK